jgi:hypothetical protein
MFMRKSKERSRPGESRTPMSFRTGDFKSPASAISPPAHVDVIVPLCYGRVKFARRQMNLPTDHRINICGLSSAVTF